MDLSWMFVGAIQWMGCAIAATLDLTLAVRHGDSVQQVHHCGNINGPVSRSFRALVNVKEIGYAGDYYVQWTSGKVQGTLGNKSMIFT